MTEQQDQNYIVREFNRFYTVHLGLLRGRYLETEFSLSEGRVMYELALNPESTANQLRTKLGLDAGYMSRLLRALGERGLVQGSRDAQDKRSTLLALTAAGQAAVADINQRASADTERMLEQLPPARRAELLAAMGTVQRILAPAAAPAIAPAIGIRRAGSAQADQATALLNEYFDLIGVVLRDDDAKIRAALDDSATPLWIAYVDGVAAACVALRPLPEVEGGRAAECKRLYVAQRFRRRGLAETLMAELERFAADARYDSVYLDTKDDLLAAIALYERLGYQRCERYNDNPQATVFMRKRL